MAFRDRRHAGRVLAEKLQRYGGHEEVVVLALPRGGVPIGFEIAKALGAPLDVFLVRKIGLPGREELAVGALASGGVRVINEDVVRCYALRDEFVEAITAKEARNLRRLEEEYRAGRPPLQIAGRIVIVVDDGLATGASMRAAAEALRRLGPKRIVVAVPVAAASTIREVGKYVDEAVCVVTPRHFLAVGMWYDNFSQITDEEVRGLLGASLERKVISGPPFELSQSGQEKTMRCEVCGNEYDKAFSVICNDKSHVFDSFECAIHALAPVCSQCGCKIIGHGIEQEGTMYCCASCARQAGVTGIADRAEAITAH